ncbi:Uncharacterised protein [uncultured archaeon]|nr:Uncharacterised protein [uncultured archaeon]
MKEIDVAEMLEIGDKVNFIHSTNIGGEKLEEKRKSCKEK